MTPEIERLAKEAGMVPIYQRKMIRRGEYVLYEAAPAQPPEWLAKFTALVAEECAKECEATHQRRAAVGNRQGFNAIMDCVDAIRAKFALSGGEDAAK